LRLVILFEFIVVLPSSASLFHIAANEAGRADGEGLLVGLGEIVVGREELSRPWRVGAVKALVLGEYPWRIADIFACPFCATAVFIEFHRLVGSVCFSCLGS
jgi:hypothetical protein